MDKINKRNIIIVLAFLIVVIFLVVKITKKEEYVYPTVIEKINYKESKCNIFDQHKYKKGAKKIKINYEKIEKEVGYDETTGETIKDKVFKINLSNISDNYYVEIYNDYTKKTEKLEIKENKASYETIYSKDIIKYTINIKTKKGKCKDELYLSKTVTLPVINNYINFKECEDNKKYKYCKEEIYESLPSIDEFYKGVK